MSTQIPQSLNSEPEKNLELPKFPFQTFFKVSDFIAGGLLVTNWIYPLYNFNKLPETLPMQYSLTGAINWSGNKRLIFLLPIGAIISYISYHFWRKSDEKILFPLKAPQNKPQKVKTLATTLSKVLEIFGQACLLAGSVLLIKGPTLAQGDRAKCIQGGLALGIISLLSAYLGINHLLHR